MIQQEYIRWPGAEDKNPAMSSEEICKLIREAGFEPAERDSLYNRI